MSTVILLRGLTRESAHWGRFPELLHAQLPGAMVQPIDLPGNGSLNAQRSPGRIDEMARAAREQVRGLGFAPPYHLLAMSLGAMVAVEWARQEPASLAGGVLVNTSLRPFSSWPQRLRPANYAKLLRVAAGWGSAVRREEAVLRMTTHHVVDVAALAREWATIRSLRPVSTGNALRQLLAAARYRAPAVAPPLPLLVLAGRGDRLVDPDCSRQLALAWGIELREHPSAGHDLCLDDGPWVARQMADWLARLASQPGRLADAGLQCPGED